MPFLLLELLLDFFLHLENSGFLKADKHIRIQSTIHRTQHQARAAQFTYIFCTDGDEVRLHGGVPLPQRAPLNLDTGHFRPDTGDLRPATAFLVSHPQNHLVSQPG